jgi:hypothetical protein
MALSSRSFAWALALLAGGCATIHRQPFTLAEQNAATIPGMAEVRFWGDAPDAAARMRPPIAAAGGPVTMLALSGGAENGAYGAGLLNGWTRSGARPEFAIVTGVSTGALIAPLAFLGSRYDAAVAQVFTTISAKNIYRTRFPLAIPGSDSIASTKPLAQLIEHYATPELIAAVAREHARGRRLFVGTANLDAGRTVVWDMGAIAASAAPDHEALFRRVLLASASVPAIFPPVAIDATANGRLVRELHVDGGTTAQALTVPGALVAADAPAPDSGRLSLYLLVDDRLGGDFHFIHAKLGPILQQAFTLNAQSATLELVQVSYLYARAHAIGFHLSYIGNEFPIGPNKSFDTAYMNRLYAYGLARGLTGAAAWQDRPPSAQEQAGRAPIGRHR